MSILEEGNSIPKLEISLFSELKLWNNLISIGLIPIIDKCVKCGKSISIKENESLNNPYIAQCCNSKYRKKYFLRTNTLFDFHSNTPISIIKYILTLSI